MKVLLPALLAVILFRASVTHAADASEIGNELPLAVADSQGTENKNHLPLYELGVGVGTLYAPDYPGSNHNSLWTLPLPFFVYRGDVFRSDKEGGMRARWSLGDSTEFYFSAGGGLPSSSTAGDARDGMPDLEWLGEVGPAVSFRLMKAESGTVIKFNIPLRMAVSTNLKHVAWRGVTLAPYLIIDQPHVFSKTVGSSPCSPATSQPKLTWIISTALIRNSRVPIALHTRPAGVICSRR